jgi:hypothetical protein
MLQTTPHRGYWGLQEDHQHDHGPCLQPLFMFRGPRLPPPLEDMKPTGARHKSERGVALPKQKRKKKAEQVVQGLPMGRKGVAGEDMLIDVDADIATPGVRIEDAQCQVCGLGKRKVGSKQRNQKVCWPCWYLGNNVVIMASDTEAAAAQITHEDGIKEVIWLCGDCEKKCSQDGQYDLPFEDSRTGFISILSSQFLHNPSEHTHELQDHMVRASCDADIFVLIDWAFSACGLSGVGIVDPMRVVRELLSLPMCQLRQTDLRRPR